MKILHDESISEAFPQKLNTGKYFTEIEMKSSASEDRFNIRIPITETDRSGLIASTHLITKIYRSSYWQEGGFSTIRIKTKDGYVDAGFLFPLTSLVSKTAGILSEENGAPPAARWYALAALWHLLAQSDIQREIPQISWGEDYENLSFYDEDLVIAIISPGRIKLTQSEEPRLWEDVSINLALIKTYSYISGEIRKKTEQEEFINNKNIKILQRSNHDSKIIQYILSHVIPNEATQCDPVARFFFQYQVFELLMQSVFSIIIANFRNLITQEGQSQDAWKTRELFSKLSEKTSEKYRISKIFEFMANAMTEATKDLNDACNSFLACYSNEQKNNEEPNPFYKVRNLVFHGFATNSVNKAQLDSICDSAAICIYTLALSFTPDSKYFCAQPNP